MCARAWSLVRQHAPVTRKKAAVYPGAPRCFRGRLAGRRASAAPAVPAGPRAALPRGTRQRRSRRQSRRRSRQSFQSRRRAAPPSSRGQIPRSWMSRGRVTRGLQRRRWRGRRVRWHAPRPRAGASMRESGRALPQASLQKPGPTLPCHTQEKRKRERESYIQRVT